MAQIKVERKLMTARTPITHHTAFGELRVRDIDGLDLIVEPA